MSKTSLSQNAQKPLIEGQFHLCRPPLWKNTDIFGETSFNNQLRLWSQGNKAKAIENLLQNFITLVKSPLDKSSLDYMQPWKDLTLLLGLLGVRTPQVSAMSKTYKRLSGINLFRTGVRKQVSETYSKGSVKIFLVNFLIVFSTKRRNKFLQ